MFLRRAAYAPEGDSMDTKGKEYALLQQPWLRWAIELQRIVQCGLAYVKEEYDRERYEQIRFFWCGKRTKPGRCPADGQTYWSRRLDRKWPVCYHKNGGAPGETRADVKEKEWGKFVMPDPGIAAPNQGFPSRSNASE